MEDDYVKQDKRTTKKTWDDFLKEFNVKYILKWVKDKKGKLNFLILGKWI